MSNPDLANICQEHEHITMARPCPWCRIRELEEHLVWWATLAGEYMAERDEARDEAIRAYRFIGQMLGYQGDDERQIAEDCGRERVSKDR